MGETRVTDKYQITIPQDVRETFGLRAGETMMVEALSDDEIRVRRFRRVRNPLGVLVGKRRTGRRVPVEKVEEMAEGP